MTNYIILVLCIIVILSYLFEIAGSYVRIPSVIFLISLGIAIQFIVKALHLDIPNLQPVLPVIGTLGLIMIVTEASLDLKLERRKKGLIIRSIASAFILFVVFTGVFTYILVEFLNITVRDSVLNGIPLGIISSSVAITAANTLRTDDKEFVVYESSFSDAFGIIAFDFILINQGTFIQGVSSFMLSFIITIIIALVITTILAILLHKISYHITYVIIMTSVVMIYVLAKLAYLPALMLVLIFGLILSNNLILEKTPIKVFVDFPKFRNDLRSFKVILTELTFLVRSFFFIMFGYYTKVEGLLDLQNILIGAAITAGIFLLRLIFFKQVLRMPLVPLVFFSPRGLITILLFLSIPMASRIPFISEEVITIVIIFTIIIMMGNIFYRKDRAPSDKEDIISISAEDEKRKYSPEK
ncbi:MAG: hypothetical protein WAL29_11990 [Bacteroidales bacterium]